MVDIARSFAIGTLGLSAILGLSCFVVFRRPGTADWQSAHIRTILLATLSLHGVHLIEETIFKFYALFPQLAGLAPWPASLFIIFNLVLITVWLSGLFFSQVGRFYAILYWFLAIASMVNAIAHPLFSLATQGYFPGLMTAPFVGVAGFVLIKKLYQITGPSEGSKHAT